MLRRWLLIALASVLFAESVEMLPQAGARLRTTLAITAVWFGLSMWLARRALLAPPYRRVVPVVMLFSYAMIAMGLIAAGENPLSADRLPAYCAMSVGWATLFLLLGLRPATVKGPELLEPSRGAIIAVVAVSALIVFVAHALATPRWPVVSDEAIYFLQSEWFFKRNHSWQVPREIADFFVMRKLGYNAEPQHFYGQYPPGWPAILAFFDAMRLRWWTSVVIGPATVALTYFVGARVLSRTAGALAATLLAVQQWFVIDNAGYMSDGSVTFTTMAGAAALLVAERARGTRRMAFGALAGLALGIGVTARPLSSIALGIAVCVWIVMRRRMTLRPLLTTAAGVAFGGLLPALLLLEYNAATNGEPLRLAYQAIHGNGYDLGFGLRGFQAYSATLERVTVPIEFTPAQAVAHLFESAANYGYAALGIALLLPLVAVALAHHVSLRLRVVVPFLLLPAVYFFYWGSQTRFYTSLLPFLMIGCAGLMLELAKKDRWVTLGLALSAVVGSVAFALPYRVSPGGLDSPWTHSAYFHEAGRQATLDSLKALGERHGPLLVFARQQSNPFDNLLDRLQVLNTDGLESRVLVARDLGARNAELRARYPDRVVYLVEDRGRDSVSRIVSLGNVTAR